MQETPETQFWSLDLEGPLAEERATHSNIFAWKIPWTEDPKWLQSIGPQRVRCDWACMHSIYADMHWLSGLPWWLRWQRISLQCRRHWTRTLGQEDPLQKRMATHSRIYAWRIPCTSEHRGLLSMGSQRVICGWVTNTHWLSPSILLMFLLKKWFLKVLKWE